jgi:hypothetical protein
VAIIRKYFTYIPNIVINSDFPGGKIEHPFDFIKYNFYNSVNMDDFRLEHYEGGDSRVLASAISDSASMTSDGEKTVLDFMIEDGLHNFNAKALTNEQALNIARTFSPARSIESTDIEGNPITITINAYE